MSQVLSAQQQSLVGKGGIAALTMIRLQLFSDRQTRTVGETFHFANRAFAYDYENTGTDREFEDFVRGVADLSFTISHLPDPDAVGFLDRRLTVELSNELRQGTRLSERLRQTFNLENAALELSQILIEKHTKGREDLSALAGNEHTRLWVGRVDRVASVDEERIVLECVTDIQTINWLRANDAATVDPSDVGIRLPVLYGGTQRIRCVSLDVGAQTTLAEVVDDTEIGNIEVTSTAGFPSAGNFDVVIGREQLTVDVAGATTLEIQSSGRAQNGTAASPHGRAEGVIEVQTDHYWAAAGHRSLVVDQVYIRNPNTQELVRLRAGDYTADVGDDDAPGFVGTELTTIHMTSEQIKNVYDDMLGIVSISGDPTTLSDQPPTTAVKTVDGGLEWNYTITPTTNPNSVWDFQASTGGAGRRSLRMWFPTSHFATPSAVVNRYRVKINWTGDFFVDGTGNVLVWDLDYLNMPGTPPSDPDSKFFPPSIPGHVTGPQEFTHDWVDVAATTLADFEATGDTAGQPRIETVMHNALSSNTNNLFQWEENTPPDTTITVTITVEFEIAPTTDASLTGASLGSQLEMFADVQGTFAYISNRYRDNNRLEYLANRNAWPLGDDDLDWNFTGTNAGTIADDTTIQLDGSAVRFHTLTTVESTGLEVQTDNWTGVDWTGKQIQIRFRWTGTKIAGGSESIQIRIFSGNGSGTDKARLWVFNHTFAPDEWHYLIVDVDRPQTDFNFDPTDVTSVEVNINDHFDHVAGDSEFWIDTPKVGDVLSTYTVADGVLLEHPADVFRDFVVEYMGAEVDGGSVANAEIDLGSNKLALDLRSLGVTSAEILAQLGVLARANVIALDRSTTDTQFALLTANPNYSFDAAAGSITEWDPGGGGIVESGRSIEELGTRFVAHYAPDPSLDFGDALFRAVAVANPTTSDVPQTTAAELATAEDEFGVIEAQSYFYLGVQDEVTAEDILGYFVHERTRLPALIALAGVPWWQGYDLQVGDIRNVTPPWKSSAMKLRVIGFSKSFENEQVSLRMIEVV